MKRLLIMVLAVCLTIPCLITGAAASSTGGNVSFATALLIEEKKDIVIPLTKATDYYMFNASSKRGFYLDVWGMMEGTKLEITIYSASPTKLFTKTYTADEDYDGFYLEVPQPKGKYYLKLTHSHYGTGGNTLKMSVWPAKPLSSLKFSAKTAKMGLGSKEKPKLAVKPSLDEVLSTDLKWKSSNSKVASVDSKGNVTAKKKGKATITAYSASSSKVKSSIVITVADNVYSVAKPRVGSGRGVYASTKKVYYKGNSVYADIYFYNKVGTKLGKIYDLEIGLIDRRDGSLWTEKYISKWSPKGGIAKNNYKVLTVNFGKLSGAKLNLVNGRYQPSVDDWFTYGKGVAGGRPEVTMLYDRELGEGAFE